MKMYEQLKAELQWGLIFVVLVLTTCFSILFITRQQDYWYNLGKQTMTTRCENSETELWKRTTQLDIYRRVFEQLPPVDPSKPPYWKTSDK
jgi:hypothetical protein